MTQLESLKEKSSQQTLASQKPLSVIESEKSPTVGEPGSSGSSGGANDEGNSDDEGSFKSLNEKDITEY